MNILTIASQMRVTHKLLAFVAFFALFVGSAQFVTTASADHGGPYGDDPITSVRLCHAPGGSGNYNDITVSVNGAGNPQGHTNQSHNDDIIPPYHWSGGVYPGQNWVTGQAIWENGCVVPETGSITIVKEVTGTSTWSIDFTSSVPGGENFTLDDQNDSESFENIDPDTYTFTEETLGGDWSLDDVSCDVDDEGGVKWSVDNNELTILLEDEDDITCTFENSYEEQNQVDYCDPSQKPGGMSIAEWLAAGQADGADCFNYEVSQSCGMLDVQFTENQTPYDYSFRYVIGTTTPELVDWEGDGELPVLFNEDEHGGSVDVTYYVVGPESEYFEGFGVPNIWDGNGTTVTVDTDCEADEQRVCELGDNLLSNGSFEDPIVTDNDGDWELTSITNWVVTKVSDGTSTLSELWRNFMGGPSDGDQHVELDAEEPTQLAQDVTTIPGATYELRFDFSPRPGTDASENDVDALVDGSAIMNVSEDGSGNNETDWTTHSDTFVANGTSTEIAFADRGNDNGEGPDVGSLIDNAVLCLVEEPDVPSYSQGSYGDGYSQGSYGGGSGGRVELREDPDPDEPEDEDEPEPEVLGEQVSAVPAGAPNTGAGGTSQNTALPMTLTLMAMLAALGTLRATREHV